VVGFVLTLTAALVVAAIVFGVAAFTMGRDPGMAPASPDRRPVVLPNRALEADDVTSIRFDTGLRGYRMEQVDTVLARLARDLAERDRRIRDLHEEVSALRSATSGQEVGGG
jgi:DivIVA domain-containing protein